MNDREGDAVTASLVVVYLIIRIALANLWVYLAPIDVQSAGIAALEVAMDLIISCLIWRRRIELQSFFIDRPAVIWFLVFGTILRTVTSPHLTWAVVAEYVILIGMAGLLGYGLVKSRKEVVAAPSPPISAYVGGVAAGVCLALVLVVERYIGGPANGLTTTAGGISLGMFILAFVHTMGHAAILEEPIFRGFLWGYLSQRGWADSRIWLIQAGLFWISHLRLIDRPFTFLVIVPLSGLVLGWVLWKARALSPCMLAHATYNALASVI